jgi:DNA replication protein DnaC
MAYDRYLLGLLERESDIRWNHRVDRLMRESRLPLEKTLDRFEMKRLPAKAVHQVKALLDGGFLERRENVLAFGNPGSGKTHLVCAIGQALVRQGREVYFSTCGLLVQELLLAKRNLQLPRMLKRLSRYQALIIDDIGYVHQDRDEMDVLFTLLAERYERGSVLITSNLPFSKWEAIFKDPMVAAAAIDRLVHHSVILELNIGSYRMSAAKKKVAEAVD